MDRTRILALALLALALLAILSACTRSTSPTAVPGTKTPRPPEVGKTAFASVVILQSTREERAADRVRISPQDVTLPPGQRFLFTAVALDSRGQPVVNVQFRWRVDDAAAGTITPTGLFHATTGLGTYPDVIEVSVSSDKGTVASTATVVIAARGETEPRFLHEITVYPPEIALPPGQVVGLGALGWDYRAQFVQNLQFRWDTVEPSAGSVDQFGFFTSSKTPGHYPDAIRVTATQDIPEGRLERIAFVSITIRETPRRGVLSRVLVFPRPVSVAPRQGVSFIVRAFDESGLPIQGVSFQWKVARPEAGRMDKPGQFVAGGDSGRYEDAVEVVARQQSSERAVEVRATVTVTVVAPPRVVGELATAQVLPGVVTLSPGQPFIFDVLGRNAGGAIVAASRAWEVVDPRAGSVGRTGLFSAGLRPGIYRNAVRVELVQETDQGRVTIEAFASVNVLGPLDRVEIRPSTLTLELGRSIAVLTVGYDAQGLEIPLLRLKWSVEDSRAGRINEAGLFTAGAVPGTYENVIKVTAVDARRS